MDSNFSNAQPYARNYLWTNIMKWKTKHRINVHTELCTFYSRDWNSMQFTFTYKLEFGPGFANEESIILKEKQKWIIFGFTNIKINISNYAPQKSALFHFHFEHFNLRSHSNCNPICYDWFKIIHAFVLLIELVSFIKSCVWCHAEKNEKEIMKIDMKRKRLSFEMDRRIWRITDKTEWQWFNRCCQRRRCRRWDTKLHQIQSR